MKRKTKDFSFAKFFNPQKSPRTQLNPEIGKFVYFPKHIKARGVVVWNSFQKGTYVKAEHGYKKLVPRHDKVFGKA